MNQPPLPSRALSPEKVPSPQFWDPLSSTIDWCEENYMVTPYIVEFVNTLTNLVFILLAVSSLRNTIAQDLEKRFILASLGFGLVGLGSWLFHMTLRYEYQLLDELPMIFTTLIVVWSLSSRPETQVAMGIGVFLLGSGITGWYLYSRDPIFHEITYGLLTICVALRTIWIMEYRVRDSQKAIVKKFGIWGVKSFLTGFLCWIIDNECCTTLIRIRRRIGMPWAFFLEFHGWWHCLTGYGVYNFLVIFQYQRVHEQGRGDDYMIVWNYRIFPTLVKRNGKKK